MEDRERSRFWEARDTWIHVKEEEVMKQCREERRKVKVFYKEMRDR